MPTSWRATTSASRDTIVFTKERLLALNAWWGRICTFLFRMRSVLGGFFLGKTSPKCSSLSIPALLPVRVIWTCLTCLAATLCWSRRRTLGRQMEENWKEWRVGWPGSRCSAGGGWGGGCGGGGSSGTSCGVGVAVLLEMEPRESSLLLVDGVGKVESSDSQLDVLEESSLLGYVGFLSVGGREREAELLLWW